MKATAAGKQVASSIISLKNVEVTLQASSGPVEILRGINLETKPGTAIGIVGPSGSGKTTLLMVLAGLEAINNGTIEVAGHDLTKLNENDLAKFRRDHVGIVFQSFHLIPAMTALENVAVPLEFKGTGDAYQKAQSALTRVGLSHRLDHYPSQLSGGEQQRVAIARAMAAGADIILADEPTGNLDQETGTKIIELLFDMQRETGTTLLLVTHDPGMAARCDIICEVRDGKIAHTNKGREAQT
jgi:putative ABC transport system ATP-binding protein